MQRINTDHVTPRPRPDGSSSHSDKSSNASLMISKTSVREDVTR